MTETQAAWLAGILDGEGCLDAPRGNPRIRVKMSDFDVVLRAAHLMDARTHLELVPNRKPLLVAQVTGPKAEDVLRAVLPYLGARRSARAAELLMLRTLRHYRPRHVLGVVPAPEEVEAA